MAFTNSNDYIGGRKPVPTPRGSEVLARGAGERHAAAGADRPDLCAVQDGCLAGGERFDLLGCATNDPHGLAAPFHSEFFTGFDVGNVYFHSGTGGLGALRWLESANKGGGDEACAYGASTS